MTQRTPLERSASPDDAGLVAAIRRGDERAFTTLVDRHYPAMVRVARATVGDDAADEVVAEAWRTALRSIDKLGAGASVKPWLIRIVLVHANRRAASGWRPDPARVIWVPEDEETLAAHREAVSELPPRQQIVIGLRDVEGWSAQEVCDTLGISPESQRALLNRARRHVHRAVFGRLASA